MLGVHKLPGGVRVIDAMGPDDDDIQWKGTFLAADVGDAVGTAQYIDSMRQMGAPVQLSWDVFQYTVIIAHFKFEEEYTSVVPFELVCKVVSDPNSPASQGSGTDLDGLVSGDMQNTLGSAQNLNMTVPGNLPTPFSSTPGSPSPANQAITWNG